jgi:pimeloyl-ACP methyl ester carboxylesterase
VLLGALITCNFPGLVSGTPTPIYVTATAVAPAITDAPTQLPIALTSVPATEAPTPLPTISYTPTFEASGCQFFYPDSYAPECGFLTVPENRADPNTDMIRLHVAIFRSANPAPEPVIHLAGGPGGSDTDLINYHFATGIGSLLENYDLIFFDQRGTGQSEPSLTCPERDDISGNLLEMSFGSAEANQREIAAFTACRDRLVAQGVDLSAYNSAASAADVNDLRIALGYSQINLYGESYGTRLALTVMRDYPQIVRSAIIDSVLPPEQNLYTSLANNAERSFNAMFSACASDPGCNAAYPDLENVFYQTVDALNANPAQVPVTDPNTGLTYSALLTGDLLVDVVFVEMYRPDVMIYVPQMIFNVQQGYYSPFLQRRLGLYFDRSAARAMTVSVQCNEEVSFSTYNDLVTESGAARPQVAHNYINQMQVLYTLCDSWGAGKANPIENQPVRSSIPTLVLAGNFDPITPPAWSRAVAETLEHAYYYEFPVGHWVMRSSPCPVQMAISFLDDPNTALDSSCVASVPQPVFVR